LVELVFVVMAFFNSSLIELSFLAVHWCTARDLAGCYAQSSDNRGWKESRMNSVLASAAADGPAIRRPVRRTFLSLRL